MIVYMKNEYLGHFSVNVFVRASDAVDIGMLGYSSDPMPAVHDFSSKTLSSNTTVSRIRHLVEKKRPKATLGRIFYERSTTLGRKKSTKCRTFRLTRLDTLLECVSRIA